MADIDATKEFLGPEPKPEVKDIEADREKARRRLAYGLICLLAFVVVALLIADFANWASLNETKDLAATILAPIVVLVGTVFGFYFGGHGTT